MSRSQAILNALVDTRNVVAEIQSTDVHGAVLTLTRTAVQAITTAGTTIVWQSEIRGYEITWAGSDITMPTSGWYAFDLAVTFSANMNDCRVFFIVNGTVVKAYNLIGDVDRNTGSVSMMRYLAESDVVRIQLSPSANVNVNVVAENLNGESPILHIVQLSGEVDV